jgi:hypothetical protein
MPGDIRSMPTPIPPETTTPAATATIELLQREIANTDTQWSLGTFGAIAEFSRDRDGAGCLAAIRY